MLLTPDTGSMLLLLCRFMKTYVLLAGLWFAKEKPPMNLFLSPLIEEVNRLFKEGMSVLVSVYHCVLSTMYVAQVYVEVCNLITINQCLIY